MSKKKSNEEFIEDSKKIHGDKYDYSLVDYKSNLIKVKIICPIHGNFEIRPNDHLSKKVGCNKCNNGGISKRNKMKSTIFNRFKKIHGDKYDYSLTDYINFDTKVKIICPIHGVFKQTPHHHVNGHGCAKCVGVYKSNTGEFIEDSKKIHGDKYDYSLVDYKNNRVKVKIKCLKHGTFEVRPNDHLNKKSGCPICKSSKGEIKIKNFFDKNKINYKQQFIFKDCKNILPLPFDFYLPDFNICVEFDGKLHFKSVEWFGGIDFFEKTKKRDKIKNEYCEKNGIKLIRIKYDDNRELEDIFEFMTK